MDEPEAPVSEDSLPERLVGFGPPAMAVLWIGGTLLAILLFPSFSWTENTINEVGQAGQPTAPILDGSLFIGSLLGVAFLWWIGKEKTATVRQAGLALMGLIIFAIGLGQLGIPQPWLLVLVLSVIWLLPVTFAVYGTGEVFAGNDRLGVLSFWFGIVHLLAWQIISNFLGFSSAIPTFITIVLLVVWILALYTEFRK